MTSRSEVHITDHDLERYHLGLVHDELELATLEEHLLCCGVCVDRAGYSDRYVDAMRRALTHDVAPFPFVKPAFLEST
jgi:hypothetical protein